MNSKRRILVADDHPVVRDGLVAAINGQPDMSACGEAHSAATIFERLEKSQPDALLMDLFLGQQDGIALIKNLLGPWPALRILVISMHEDHIYAARCWQAGALGYVSKLEPAAEILNGLRSVLAGRLYFKAEVLAEGKAGGCGAAALTDRELHVLKLIGQGLKSGQIAEHLNISPRTVDTHRENIKQKLGATNSSQLIRLALELGAAGFFPT